MIRVLTSLPWQLGALLVSWAWVVVRHAANDGLWYQGDSSRHAINGLFWWDFLKQGPTSPLGFALSYYARYPVINPVAYPPFFYLVEGGAYQVFGISPFVSKGLVLASVLLGAGYLCAWLRRWVAPAAGWAALLVVLQPGVITWSHAVMLNVPAMALAMATLYHARRWIEEPESKHRYLTVGLGTLAVLTYLPIAVIVPIIVLWALWERRLLRLVRWRTALVVLPPAAGVAAWVLLAVPWAQSHAAVARSVGANARWTAANWLYYATHLPEIVAVPTLVLAVVGIAAIAFRRERRRDVMLAMIWLVTSYAWFSLITPGFAEARYFLIAVPVLVWMATLGVIECLAVVSRPAGLRTAGVAVAVLLLALHVGLAARVHVRDVRGFRDVATYVRSVAPNERVFYDGQYDGIFAFYLRAIDPGLTQAVTRGANLVYSTRLSPKYGFVEHVSAESDITELLTRECGCRYFVVEKQLAADMTGVRAAANLRTVLDTGPFEVVRKFRVSTPDITDVWVYRQTAPTTTQAGVRLHFPFLGDGKARDVAPVQATRNGAGR